MQHLLSLYDLSSDEIFELIELAIKLKKDLKNKNTTQYLKGRSLGMIFSKSSTRTRVSFEVGMYQLGGPALFLSNHDIQIGRGESVSDTAKVLSRYLDGVMIRTFKQSDVEEFAEQGTIPVINGLTDDQHPCQVLADLQTIYEHKKKLKGLKLAYIGDGKKMAHSLLHGCTKVGMHIAIASPEHYTCNPRFVEEAQKTAKETNVTVLMTQDPTLAIRDADVVYTDTWASMGQEAEKEKRSKIFADYQINTELFGKAAKNAIFLHCLPAYRGLEVASEVIDGPQSVVFDEAENRLHAQKAVMVKLMG